ncbi:hypothetical protein SAMN06295970_102387 [Noviherbaspirillum suwonense]|jgi:hypothetical protein|uniref:Uncharacterized protein n=2 Tax=Noviherbaspirillum suwonense TaxID=1224511 RepID=A0ABY1PWM0_9BURK|nr:hypothetical protein SAMN06295970_102387 [Noviherbaspirillum suwonense]
MQQPPNTQFIPRWVIFIFVMSVMEAVGLCIYFKVSLPDPEVVSIEQLYMDAEHAPAAAAAQPGCEQCPLLARSPQHVPLRRR